MLKKPETCFKNNCPLATKGYGYGPADGPETSKLLVVGEALGKFEAIQGKPFVGQSGAFLDKLFRDVGINRDYVRIDNTCRCQPPNNWLDNAPWEQAAIASCFSNLEHTLNNPNVQVVVPMGATAIRRVCNFSKLDWRIWKKPLENFHGTVHRDHLDRFWIVPTWHPSFLMRGNHKLMGVVMADLLTAKAIIEEGWEQEQPTLKIDPPVEWFNAWVQTVLTKAREFAIEHGYLPWLACDIETPEKEKGVDESEVEIDDPSYIITRINFAVDFDMDFALTVPWSGPYIGGIIKLLASEHLRTAFWNANYDRPRLIRNGCQVKDPWVDVMDAWHFLQSSLPRGLGFVAPFYSRFGAWKHLSGSEPGRYAAIDALQTVRISVGVEEDLRHNGQWDYFERHGPLVDRYALKPAEAVGIRIETDKDSPNSVHRFEQVLSRYKSRLIHETSKHVPEELIPLDPKDGYKRQPLIKGTKDPRPGYFTITRLEDCYKCNACEQTDVTTKHRCKERKIYEAEHNKSPLEFGEWEVTKWYTKGEFNPNSPQQMLDYIKFKRHKPGKQKKTHNDSADADTIEKLYKKHGDPLYGSVLSLRKVTKIKGTYVDGAIRQMDDIGRVHSVFTNRPSTWRTSSQGFNLQNVVSAGKREDMGLGQRFRQCVVPEPGCYLVEADFAGIEAVEVGWFANDPQYVRLAKMSTHAFITTNMKGFEDKVAHVDWDDDELREYLKWVKGAKKYKLLYNRAKRVVHGSNYGLTATGLKLTYPEEFPTVSAAQEVIDLMFDLFPSVKSWQHSTRQRAHKQHYLGGSDHPFRYKHWFWNVYNFTRISASEAKAKLQRGLHVVEIAGQWYDVQLGSDSKKCIAFYPQSTAGGVLREALLALFTPGSEYYIGEAFHGKTPLRTPIHDSILLEVPEAKLTDVTEKLYAAMTLPITTQPLPWKPEENLEIGVDIEIGRTWGHMKSVDIDELRNT